MCGGSRCLTAQRNRASIAATQHTNRSTKTGNSPQDSRPRSIWFQGTPRSGAATCRCKDAYPRCDSRQVVKIGMAAPQAIVDALESVVSVYFSNVRHRARAAFLLCDELIEMTCKAKARQANHKESFNNFYECLCKGAVGLDPAQTDLGRRVLDNHETRNVMQHSSAAATVDDQHCADAIMYGVAVIDHCFPDTTIALHSGLAVSSAFAACCPRKAIHDNEPSSRHACGNTPGMLHFGPQTVEQGRLKLAKSPSGECY
jgi:hypothetical protein